MLRAVIRLLFRLVYRVRVRGQMHPRARLLIVANHVSFLDPLLLGAFLPVEPYWLIHTMWARRWYVRVWLRFFPHLAVDTRNPLAVKAAIELIEAGKPVLIFPEGRITVTGGLMKTYEGPAFVAARSGATVVPVHIEGAVYTPFSRMRGDYPRRWFPRVTLTILPERRIEAGEGSAKQRRRRAADTLRRIMQETVYAAREPACLFAAFLDSMALHGRRSPILRDIKGRELRYADLLKGMLALGRITARLSDEGERVGVLMPNVAATVSLVLGMAAMRRVPAMLNYSAGQEAMQSACRAAGVRTVIASRQFLEQARVAPPGGVRVVYLEDLRATFTLADKLWLLWALRWPRRAARPAHPHEPAVVLFTSGSEGKPKGVVLSHDNLLANIAQIRAVIDFTSKDKFLSCLPLFHAFGLTVGAILPLLNGCRIVLHPSPLHYRSIPELIYEWDCTVMFATNTFLGYYGKYAHPYDLARLRILVAGAEKVTDEVRRLYADKFGLRVLEGYGITEASPVLAVNTPMAARTGTVGEMLPGLECLVDPVPGLEGGILHVRGANIMLGYLKEDRPGELQPPRSRFGEGWHETGDVVRFEDGFLRIVGRMKRFAKVAGEMVSLEVAERIAAAASPGHQHATVAMAQPGRGEMILLLTEDRDLNREALLEAARRLGAPELALPRRVMHVKSIPLLGSGKKDYGAVAQLARELTQPVPR